MAAEVVAVDLVAASIDGNLVGACNGLSFVEESALYLLVLVRPARKMLSSKFYGSAAVGWVLRVRFARVRVSQACRMKIMT